MTEEVKHPFQFKQEGEGEKLVLVTKPADLLSTTTYVDFSDTSNEDMFNATKEALGESLGYGVVNAMGRIIPLATLARIKPGLEQHYDDYDVAATEFERLFTFLDAYLAEKKKQLQTNIARGVLEWDDVQFIFEKGTPVVAIGDDDELLGGYVDSTNRVQGFMSLYYEVKIKVIHGLAATPQEGLYSARVGSYRGMMKLSDLPVRFATEEDKKFLTERGALFRKVTSEASYLHYEGQVKRTTWHSQKSYRSFGRVMIDAGSFQQVDSEQAQNEGYQSGIQGLGRNAHQQRAAAQINDEDLWICAPFVYGFSFSSKQWGRMNVAKLKSVEWRDDAWEKLVLEPELKELVRALVDNQHGTFEDIVEGKGGGTIFLLHGPPGQGKTLTAETIAERLHRPLYSVSVGELGVDPDELEKRLRVILDIATVWNAVILIDEADIFLEERDEHNIVRNAMVGVFLRLLEYHQGVLFLTTNRVKTIDEAFYSRISVAIYFKDEGITKREKVWTNLLASAKIEGLDPVALSAHELNGRQIKNVIRQAQTLSRDRNEPVSSDIVREVVDLTAKFKTDLKALRGEDA